GYRGSGNGLSRGRSAVVSRFVLPALPASPSEAAPSAFAPDGRWPAGPGVPPHRRSPSIPRVVSRSLPERRRPSSPDRALLGAPPRGPRAASPVPRGPSPRLPRAGACESDDGRRGNALRYPEVTAPGAGKYGAAKSAMPGGLGRELARDL